MSVITAEMVKELRERTGAGMLECKKALVTSEGNIETAIEAMRKSGQAKADKKAGRVAAEGVVMVARRAKSAVILEVNCETDFVTREPSFKEFAEKLSEIALATRSASVTELLAQVFTVGKTVEEARRELVVRLGENIHIRRLVFQETAHDFGAYSHGGRIGVIVEVVGGSADLAKDIAMHIAASAPMVVSVEQIPPEFVAKEKEICMAQAQSSGKTPEIIEKMIQGRLQKTLEEMALLGQAFVKNPELKISALLKEHAAQVLGFVRYKVGEGIEKEAVDFAAEVLAQARGCA